MSAEADTYKLGVAKLGICVKERVPCIESGYVPLTGFMATAWVGVTGDRRLNIFFESIEKA